MQVLKLVANILSSCAFVLWVKRVIKKQQHSLDLPQTDCIGVCGKHYESFDILLEHLLG